MKETIINRMEKPLKSIRSLRGLIAFDTLKILLSIFIGYLTVPAYKVLKVTKASIEKEFGVTRTGFIFKLANLKHVLNRTSDGFLFVVRTQDPIDYGCTSAEYEPEVKQVFKPKQGEVVIDIGAHIGAYTIRAARAVGEDGLVIALEPDPENFRLLGVNVKLNELSNVVALRIAAHESDGASSMYKSQKSSCHSLVRVPGEFVGEMKVPTITLDTLVRRFNLDIVDWVKVDVEAAELTVLRGANKTLELAKKLIIEVWHENSSKTFSILKSRGYKVTVLFKGENHIDTLAER